MSQSEHVLRQLSELEDDLDSIPEYWARTSLEDLSRERTPSDITLVIEKLWPICASVLCQVTEARICEPGPVLTAIALGIDCESAKELGLLDGDNKITMENVMLLPLAAFLLRQPIPIDDGSDSVTENTHFEMSVDCNGSGCAEVRDVLYNLDAMRLIVNYLCDFPDAYFCNRDGFPASIVISVGDNPKRYLPLSVNNFIAASAIPGAVLTFEMPKIKD